MVRGIKGEGTILKQFTVLGGQTKLNHRRGRDLENGRGGKRNVGRPLSPVSPNVRGERNTLGVRREEIKPAQRRVTKEEVIFGRKC